MTGGSESRASKKTTVTGENSRTGAVHVRTDHYIELSDSVNYKQPGSEAKVFSQNRDHIDRMA
jgi:hypothetical protein